MSNFTIPWHGLHQTHGDQVILSSPHGGSIEVSLQDVDLTGSQVMLRAGFTGKIVVPPTSHSGNVEVAKKNGEFGLSPMARCNGACPQGGPSFGQTYALLGVVLCCDGNKQVDFWQ